MLRKDAGLFGLSGLEFPGVCDETMALSVV